MTFFVQYGSGRNAGLTDAIVSSHASSSLPTISAIIVPVTDLEMDASRRVSRANPGSFVVMFFTERRR